jgi:hypothetical protein
VLHERPRQAPTGGTPTPRLRLARDDEAAATTPVDGLVHLDGHDLSIVRWYHHPEAVRAALRHSDGEAAWSVRWNLLVSPGFRGVFNLARVDQKTECQAARVVVGS